jgi:hypothetical protein
MQKQIQLVLQTAADYTDVRPFEKIFEEYEQQLVNVNAHRARRLDHVAHFEFVMNLFLFMRDNVDFKFSFEELVRCELVYVMGLTGLNHPLKSPQDSMSSRGFQDFIFLGHRHGLELTDTEFMFCTSDFDYGIGKPYSQISRIVQFADRFHRLYTPEEAVIANGGVGLDHKEGPVKPLDVEGDVVFDEDGKPEDLTEEAKERLKEEVSEEQEPEPDPTPEPEEREPENPKEDTSREQEEEADFDSWWDDDEEEEKEEEKPTENDRVEADRDFEDLFG